MKSREWNYSGTIEKKISIREQVHHILARKVAEEAVVLLKNEAVLPLPVDMPVALLGSGAQKTVKGGIGSGDVNNRRTISVCQGMLDAGAVITSKEWLCDYEKRYEQARKEKEAKKKQKVIDIKEIRLSPNIDTNDLNTKIGAARKFLTKGDRVKITLRFRGREMAHMNNSKHILDDIAQSLSDIAVVEKAPKVEGRSMTMFLTEKR